MAVKMNMATWILAVLCLVSVNSQTLECYNECVQKFTIEMDQNNQSNNDTGLSTSIFCKAMSNQIDCLNSVIPNCPAPQRTMIQSMLTVFIQPDYQRTCEGGNGTIVPRRNGIVGLFGTTGTGMAGTGMTSSGMPSMGMTGTGMPAMGMTGSGMTSMGFPGMAMPGYGGSGPNLQMASMFRRTSQTLVMCTQKVNSCQRQFNSSFSASMAVYNVSGLCQSLKEYTLCFVNLLSSDCGHLVSHSVVLSMQQHYGSMCSDDAQANTHTMIECTNMTMQCYAQFNSSFSPAIGDNNLIQMCSAFDNYTSCMQTVSRTTECSQYASTSLTGIGNMRKRHYAFCGDDNGQKATQCVQDFQDCFVPFNMTFFPALHSANLTMICSALTTYASCVTRLTPTCSQQLGQIIQAAQAMQVQYSRKCHPNILKLATCGEVGQCHQVFIKNFATGMPSNAGLCGSIGEYFSCVERGLDTCGLPQSTTEVEFGSLGVLMKEYCTKVSSVPALIRCPAFVKCSTAIWVSFSPTMKDKYEGSTWCTFMQLSIGCAEHALQSTDCFLDGDLALEESIRNVDLLRVKTCEIVGTGIGIEGIDNTSFGDNVVDPDNPKGKHGKHTGDENAAGLPSKSVPTLITGLFLWVLVCLAPDGRI